MKTYTDAQVRAALALLIKKSSYRRVAKEIGVEASGLFYVVSGQREPSERIGAALGFQLCERQWILKKESK
jgi:hypothetical protein